MVVGKHRKRPLRLKDYDLSYTLDSKVSVPILLALAECLKEPGVNVYLVALAKEEVGAIGALYFMQRQPLDAPIALEIGPLVAQYPILDGENPVLLVHDGCAVYEGGTGNWAQQRA
jgi:putative aminopeptidase FrvX